jgi:hypothetical protein
VKEVLTLKRALFDPVFTELKYTLFTFSVTMTGLNFIVASLSLWGPYPYEKMGGGISKHQVSATIMIGSVSTTVIQQFVIPYLNKMEFITLFKVILTCSSTACILVPIVRIVLPQYLHFTSISILMVIIVFNHTAGFLFTIKPINDTSLDNVGVASGLKSLFVGTTLFFSYFLGSFWFTVTYSYL